MPLPPQRAVRMPQRLRDTQGGLFLWVGRRGVYRATLDEDAHKENKGHTHQQDSPPVFLRHKEQKKNDDDWSRNFTTEDE